MSCDIIIPIWNQLDVTRDCVESLSKNTKYPHRLILVDNASDAGTRLYLEGIKKKNSAGVELIVNKENLGFVKAVNQGLKISTAPYVCIMNNDTVPYPGWLEAMVDFAETHKDVGLINPQCDRDQRVPIDEYMRWIKSNKGKYMEMNQCFLFCSLVKREVIEKIGGLDERFGMGCFDDTDFAMRAGLAGYRCVCIYSAYVHHVHGVSFKALGNRQRIVEKCEREFFKKWPRHLRIGVSFSLNETTRDEEIENLLRTVLFLARQWCWINLWIFGDREDAKKRLDDISKRIDMPLHQNIKFNLFGKKSKKTWLLIRLIERSFGTKARKRYDAVFADDAATVSFLSIFRPIHGVSVQYANFNNSVIKEADDLITKIRGRRNVR